MQPCRLIQFTTFFLQIIAHTLGITCTIKTMPVMENSVIIICKTKMQYRCLKLTLTPVAFEIYKILQKYYKMVSKLTKIITAIMLTRFAML